MTSLLLQFVFIVLLVILPMALYRSRRSFMAVFYRAMTDNAQARKFYTQVLVVLLLLFHYVYTTGHPGQFGTVLSAIVCAAMFSCQEDGQMAPQAARPSEGICRLRRLRTGCMYRAAVVHPVRYRLIYPSGSPVLSLRQSSGRMGGPGQETLPVGTSG